MINKHAYVVIIPLDRLFIDIERLVPDHLTKRFGGWGIIDFKTSIEHELSNIYAGFQWDEEKVCPLVEMLTPFGIDISIIRQVKRVISNYLQTEIRQQLGPIRPDIQYDWMFTDDDGLNTPRSLVIRDLGHVALAQFRQQQSRIEEMGLQHGDDFPLSWTSSAI